MFYRRRNLCQTKCIDEFMLFPLYNIVMDVFIGPCISLTGNNLDCCNAATRLCFYSSENRACYFYVNKYSSINMVEKIIEFCHFRVWKISTSLVKCQPE